MTRFRDRADAGRRLAERVRGYAGRGDVVVLALPRGGVAVGLEVARALDAPLDVLIVRKLGVPGQEELAMGAIASGGAMILNEEVIRALGVTDDMVARASAQEQQELQRREQAYRGGRRAPEVADRTVILVDDGVATGSTVRAAIAAVREARPARIVVAVPVAPPAACEMLGRGADEVVCLTAPREMFAISQWYESFPQLSDEDVRRALADAPRSAA